MKPSGIAPLIAFASFSLSRVRIPHLAHPRLDIDTAKPVGGNWNPSEVQDHVLLAERPNWNLSAIAVR